MAASPFLSGSSERPGRFRGMHGRDRTDCCANNHRFSSSLQSRGRVEVRRRDGAGSLQRTKATTKEGSTSTQVVRTISHNLTKESTPPNRSKQYVLRVRARTNTTSTTEQQDMAVGWLVTPRDQDKLHLYQLHL